MTVLSGIVYAFPEARPCHSRVVKELEGYGGEQLDLRGGHFVPTGEGNDIIKNSSKSCSEMQSPLRIIPRCKKGSVARGTCLVSPLRL